MSKRLPTALALSLVFCSAAIEAQRSTLPRPPAPIARGGFEIVSCSLGCVPGPSLISCGTTDIHVNEVLRITFNQPVALASADSNSFQVIEAGTGRTPPASFALDPLDPNTLIYQPQMFFDSAGNPVFGLQADRVYLLKLPGVVLDPLGPHVTSLGGEPNRTRLQCVLIADRGVLDAVPGRPLVKLYVQTVLERDPVTGEPLRIATVPAGGATDVLRASPIEIVFNDVMNPATVANPVTGQSSFIRVRFDPDGNVQDASDQMHVAGFFTITIDQVRSVTRAVFHAEGGLPAAGSQRRPGRVVVDLSPQVQDLAGNGIVNPGRTNFTTEAR